MKFSQTISLFSSDYSLLGTNLQAEAAVYTGPPVDYNLAVLALEKRWTFEKSQAVFTAHAGAHCGHGDGGCGTLHSTHAAGRALAVINDVSVVILADGILWTVDETRVAFGAGSTGETPLSLLKDFLLVGEELHLSEVLLPILKG